MKKYFIASVVAVLAFAFAAFANSLQVNDSVLAAGAGDVLTCADDVNVTWLTSNDSTSPWVGGVELEFVGGDECEDERPQVFVMDGTNILLWAVAENTVDGGTVEMQFASSAGTWKPCLLDDPISCAPGELYTPNGTIRAEDVDQIQVLVKDRFDANEQAVIDFITTP